MAVILAGEAERLLAALREPDRAVWATAIYAGLRGGELRALRWEDVDLASGILRVSHGWDDKEGQIDLKTRSGKRNVPVAAVLRDHLMDHKLRSGRARVWYLVPMDRTRSIPGASRIAPTQRGSAPD